MTLSAARMRSLPEFFQDIDDPRRRQGRRHALPSWPWPPPRRSAACAATRRSANGSTISAPRSAALPRAPPRRPIPPAQPLRDAQPAHPRRPGAARRRPAVVARGPWLSRQRAGHRRQDHPRRHRCRQAHVLGIVGHDTRHPGVKKSRHEAGRRRRGEAHQRDRHRHPPARGCPTANRTVTADALLTQRALANTCLAAAQTICSPSRATSRPCRTTSASCSLRPSPGARRTS